MINDLCYHVSDLHGSKHRYESLFHRILSEQPAAVFMGGDILPSGSLPAIKMGVQCSDFIGEYLRPQLNQIKKTLGPKTPKIFVILGNDDPRSLEPAIKSLSDDGLCEYIHNKKVFFRGFTIYGYSFVPPTPFMFKDWERYDVSRYVDPGCVAPDEGYRSIPQDTHVSQFATIKDDLLNLTSDACLDRSILLFHSPPYNTNLDRADLDGKMIDHVPLDVHVGSIAIERFIEERQPYLTLHGHVHESAELTGSWTDTKGTTPMFTGAHSGPELALIKFDLHLPESAIRELI